MYCCWARSGMCSTIIGKVLIGYWDFQQVGSILAVPESLNKEGDGEQYIVEGIGYDFIPDVLNRSDVDVWLKTKDEESFAAVQILMRKEGLLVGGSSGTALAGALRWLKTEQGQKVANKPGKNVVVLLPDGWVSNFTMLILLRSNDGPFKHTELHEQTLVP